MKKRQRGQALVEFAVVAPLLALLIMALVLAFLYAWRAATVDMAIFAAGAATGSYEQPRTETVLPILVWTDLREALQSGVHGNSVTTNLIYGQTVSGPLGLMGTEVERGQVTFRLWRFYPGPKGEP